MSTDRNLLFGVLALQAGLIDSARFAEACAVWAARKTASLAELLVERGWITAEDRASIERLLERKLQQHHGDVRASLAEAAGPEVHRVLAGLNDPDIALSLADLASSEEGALETVPTREEHRQRYLLLRMHAEGGIGRVWLARDVALGRDVALKELRPERTDSPQLAARFLAEAQVTGQLEHPGIVPVYELVQPSEGQQPFYTMRFLRGRTLSEAIHSFHQKRQQGQAGTLDLLTLLNAFVAVCNAVAYAHSRGVIHRDLKPANVVLGSFGEVMVLDWGLARVQGTAEEPATELPVTLTPSGEHAATLPGELLGTPAYMAPEQASGRADLIDARSDVYGLGAILYEMLTGQPPFTGNNLFQVLQQVLHEEPARPRTVWPGVAPALESVCRKALAKKREERYATAGELAQEVQRWLADEPVLAHEESWTARLSRWSRRHRAWVRAAAAALVLVSAVAVGAAFWVNDLREKELHAQMEQQAEAARRAEAEARQQSAEERAAREQAERQRAQALPWLEKAAVARADGFRQAEAVYLAEALMHRDEVDLRVQWMKAAQLSLVPVQTTSRRLAVNALAYSPEGGYLVSADLSTSTDAETGVGTIRLWRTKDWVQEAVFHGHDLAPGELSVFPIRGFVFRPGQPGEMITAGRDGILRVWNLATQRELRRSPASAVPLTALAIEPGPGRLLLTGNERGLLTWWDAESMKPIKAGPTHGRSVIAVCCRPDGGQWASASDEGTVRLWNAPGELEGELAPPGHKAELDANPLHEAGAFLMPSSLPGLLICSRLFARMPLRDLSYSPDGKQLAAASQDGCLYIWNVETRRLLFRLEGHEPASARIGKQVICLAYAGAERLFSGGVDGTVREWDTRAGKQVAIRGRHDRNLGDIPAVRGLAVRPGGREVASCGADLTIRVWDADTGSPRVRLEGMASLSHADYPPVSGFCPARNLLLTAAESHDAFLRAWDVSSLREKRTYTGLSSRAEDYPHRISALAIRPDGGRFVSAEPGGSLLVWDTQSGAQLAELKAAHQPRDISAKAEWLRRTGSEQEAESPALAVSALAWSGSGRQFASAGVDRTIKVWDGETGKPIAQWKEADAEVPIPEARDFSFKADGLKERLKSWDDPTRILFFDAKEERLITAGRDNVVRLWSIAERRITDRLRAHSQLVTAGTLSADRKYLATGSADGITIVWDLDKRVPLRTFQLPALMLPERHRAPVPSPRGKSEQLFQVDTLEQAARRVLSLALSPDRVWLAVLLGDGSVSLIHLATGTPLYRGAGHEPPLLRVGFTGGEIFFTASGDLLTLGIDGTLRRWDLPGWQGGSRLLSSRTAIEKVAASPDGSEWAAVAGTRDGFVRWDRHTGKPLPGWEGVEGKQVAWHLTYSPHEQRVVAVIHALGSAAHALVLDRTIGKVQATFPRSDERLEQRKPGQMDALAIQTRGPLAASACNFDPDPRRNGLRILGSVDLWRVSDGRWVRSLGPLGGRVHALAFHPAGRQLAVLTEFKTLSLWDVETGKPLFQNLEGARVPTGMCYSPDGKQLVQAAQGELVLWDPETGQRIRSVPVGEPVGGWSAMSGGRQLYAPTFSPDGRWLAAGTDNGMICLWDGKTYHLKAQFSTLALQSYHRVARFAPPGPDRPFPDLVVAVAAIRTVAFSADSRELIASSGGREKGAVVFDLEAILAAEARQTASEMRETTQRLTGLRLHDGGLVPIEQNRLVPVLEPPLP